MDEAKMYDKKFLSHLRPGKRLYVFDMIDNYYGY